jgi:Spy/CpxP family protein refolding chaperone
MSHTKLRAVVRAALTLSTLVAVSAASAQAQPPAGGQGGQGRGRMTQMLFEGITLTEAQTKSRDSIVTVYREKMMAAQGEERRTIGQDQRKALRGILTPEQQKTFDANVEKLPAGRPGGPGTR